MSDPITLEMCLSFSLHSVCHTDNPSGNPTITGQARLRHGTKVLEKCRPGNGPIDALFHALISIVQDPAWDLLPGKLCLTQLMITSEKTGSEAKGKVSVAIHHDGQDINDMVTSSCYDTDIAYAAAQCIVGCLNQLLVIHESRLATA